MSYPPPNAPYQDPFNDRHSPAPPGASSRPQPYALHDNPSYGSQQTLPGASTYSLQGGGEKWHGDDSFNADDDSKTPLRNDFGAPMAGQPYDPDQPLCVPLPALFGRQFRFVKVEAVYFDSS